MLKASPAESDLDSFIAGSITVFFDQNRHGFIALKSRAKTINNFCFWDDWMMALQLRLALTTSAWDQAASLKKIKGPVRRVDE
jgi:hypothetical protein